MLKSDGTAASSFFVQFINLLCVFLYLKFIGNCVVRIFFATSAHRVVRRVHWRAHRVVSVAARIAAAEAARRASAAERAANVIVAADVRRGTAVRARRRLATGKRFGWRVVMT